MDKLQEIADHQRAYLQKTQSIFQDDLGGGQDGSVISIADRAGGNRRAIKLFAHEELYRQELAVYQRLRQLGINWIEVRDTYRFKIPELISWDDELRVIEMTVVTPPFLLDFAGAKLDRKPAIFGNRQRMGEWNTAKQDQFGPKKWEIARLVIAKLRGMDIYLTDINPGNLTFGTWFDD